MWSSPGDLAPTQPGFPERMWRGVEGEGKEPDLGIGASLLCTLWTAAAPEPFGPMARGLGPHLSVRGSSDCGLRDLL